MPKKGRRGGIGKSNIGGDLSVFHWDVEVSIEINEVRDAVHDGVLGVKGRNSLAHEVEQGLGDGHYFSRPFHIVVA